MIKRLKRKEEENFTAGVIKGGVTPVSVIISNQDKNNIQTDDGEFHLGMCINCNDKPCYSYLENEIDLDILEGLPYNNDRRVCPSEAISITRGKGIDINPELCIGCGICMYRCPTAGISMDDKGIIAHVHYEENGIFEMIDTPYEARQKETYILCDALPKEHKITKITSEFAESFTKRFLSLSKRNRTLELVLLRNFLLQIGISVKASATGNNDARADLVGLNGGYFLPIESELQGTDILGLPRRILENIAFLHTRHGIDTSRIQAIASFLFFPRKRSDMYEVIGDIKKITGFEIKILPLYTLYLLSTFGITLSMQNILDDFYIDHTDLDFSKYIKKYIPAIEEIDENFSSELMQFGK